MKTAIVTGLILLGLAAYTIGGLWALGALIGMGALAVLWVLRDERHWSYLMPD